LSSYLPRAKSKHLKSCTYAIKPAQQIIHTTTTVPCPLFHLRDIQQLLQLDDQLPLILTNIAPEELLERVDALTAHERVQRVVFLQVAAVHGLVRAFDLDGDGGLTLFAHGDLLVVALDGGAVGVR
jgi:hypothetical protein